VVERATLVCDSESIEPKDLPPEIRGVSAGSPKSTEAGYKAARREFERAYFSHLMERAKGNVQKAAEIAGIHRTTLYEKLSKLDIRFER